MRKAVLLLAAASLLLLASCKKKVLWQTDFDAALGDAGATGRSVLVLFSGEDWDGKSSVFRSEVLDTDEFKDSVKDSYVLLNIDLSEAEQAKAIAAEDADEKARAEAEKLRADIETKTGILRRYGVSSYPSIYLLSEDGYVLSIVQYSEGLTSPAVLDEILEEQAGSIQAVLLAIARVRSSSGSRAEAPCGAHPGSPRARSRRRERSCRQVRVHPDLR